MTLFILQKLHLFINHRGKVELILKQLELTEVLSVPDPYFGGDQGFEHVYQLLDKACQQIIDNIKTPL